MKLTKAEERAVRLLEDLAQVWPKSLQLFSWSGSLKVVKPRKGVNMRDAVIRDVRGIPNDGGDPPYSHPSR